MNQKGFAVVYLILGLVILLFGAIYTGKLPVNLPFSQTSTPVNQQPSSNWQQIETEETVNWKEYTNTQYGYVIKYPQDYQENLTLLNLSNKPLLLQSTSFYAVNPKSGGGPAPFISVIVWKKENTSLIRWLDDHSTSEAFDSEKVQENSTLFYPGVASKKEVKIANRNGFRFTSTTINGPVERTIIDGGLYVYEVSLWTNNNLSKDPEISNNYQLSLSTFKFTGQGQTAATSDWKAYINTKHSYELKYPNDWQLVASDQSSIKLYPPTSEVNSKWPQPGISVAVLTRPFTKPTEKPSALTEISPITISGIKGYKFSAQGAPFSTINVELPYQNRTLSIVAAKNKAVDLNMFDQILSTFKFTSD